MHSPGLLEWGEDGLLGDSAIAGRLWHRFVALWNGEANSQKNAYLG
jgi:hypothetical protein